MNRHASMNRLYRLVWSEATSAWVPVAETTKARCKSGRSESKANRNVLAAAICVALSPLAHASPPASICIAPACGSSVAGATLHPLGAQVVSGSASITQSGNTTDIRQSSTDVSIDWQSFNIGSQATVDFLQPSASAVAVNRIIGNNGTQILGHLDANGQVYLINPNGIIFGAGAQVNVGGLVASTLDVTNSASTANTQSFNGSGAGSIVNEGMINAANGGYVALLSNRVSNQGVITAQLGTVAIGAGSAVTLDFSGNRLVHLQVDQSTLNNLAQNKQLIEADGGLVMMSAGAKNALLASVVNNSGIIEARTVRNHNGTIELLGGMTAGTVNVGGTLDASAPNGGNGGVVVTNAAHVEVACDAKVTTAASSGLTGSWLVDPNDFTVAASGGDITGATLSSELGTTSIVLLSSSGSKAGSGSINVDDTVSWSTNTLTLTAANNVNINAVMTAAGSASLTMNPSTANGSDTAVPGGTVAMGLNGSGFTGTVNFNSTGALSISGITFTVINSLGGQGSTTGTDLQGINGNLSGHYAVGGNIDATATSIWNAGAGFTPIGNPNTPFSGTFDGLGHTISNLTINLSTNNYVGLFGYASLAGLIQNVGLVNAGVVLGGSYGSNDVGGLVGYNAGTISNSYVGGSVAGYFPQSLQSGGSLQIGGLVGYNAGTISNSYATGNVQGNMDYSNVGGPVNVGGLVGTNSGTISNSFAMSDLSGFLSNADTSGVNLNLGGLAGYNEGLIGNSYATGNMQGAINATDVPNSGGLVGYNASGGNITNSYATGTVQGPSSAGAGGAGGLVGYNAVGGSIVTSFATGAVGSFYGTGGLVGNNYGTIINSYETGNVGGGGGDNVGGGLVAINGGIISNSYATGSFSGAEIGGGLVGANAGTISNSYAMGSVSGSYYHAGGLVGNNSGTIINSYAMSNVRGGSIAGGLVGHNASGAYILNSHATGTITLDVGNDTAGGLVGSNDGTVSNSYATGGVFAYGGSSGVGGLVGYNSGSISNSYASGEVIGSNNAAGLVGYNAGSITNSYATGLVGGSNYVGGSTGYNSGSITNSYATGMVDGADYVGGLIGYNQGGMVNTSYVTGGVNGKNFVGGLAGFNSGGAINTSYAMGSVSGKNFVGGLVGSNTGTVSDSYSVGRVIAIVGAGGLVAYNSGGTVSNSFWDVNTSGMGTSAGGTGMTTANMQAYANFTSATAANGNVSPGWDFINTWVLYDGYTYPLLRTFMTPLTVTANNASETYNGAMFSGGNGVGFSIAPNDNLIGSVSYSGTSQGAINVGSYAITPNGLYSNQQGYIITFNGGSLTINQLASVAWTGGPTGNWSNAANWAGGAIPDLANVANVTIPKGTTVTYDPGMAGTTVLSSLTDAGKLVMAAGDLAITGNFSTAGYQQTGGLLDVGGTLSINSTAGTVTLGEIDAGALSVTSKTGVITQLAGAALDVIGAASLTADNGLSGAQDVKYNITLANATNNFEGTVTTNGANINIADGAGGLVLGNTTATGTLGNPATGTLTVTSFNGGITQAAGAALNAHGTTSLTADNGGSGARDIKYNVTLANTGNNFVSAVNSNGLNINLADATGGITLGNTTATGTLTVTSRGAAILQLRGTSINVSGVTSLTGDNGVSGAGDLKYAVSLKNKTDRFGGTVTAVGGNITLYDTSALTAALTSVGAVSLTSAGPLFVSGTIGTTLKTTTTGTGHTTTFGATTVGTSLNIISTGAVTEAVGDELLVNGAGTDATDPVNMSVTVNGKNGAVIN